MEPKETWSRGPVVNALLASCTNEFNQFRSAAPLSPHCCERRSLIVTVFFVCGINTLIALFALALVLNARAEIGRLKFVQTKLQEQKVRDRVEIRQLQTNLQQHKV